MSTKKLCLIVAILAFAGCSSSTTGDDSNGDGNGNGTGVIKGTVDGKTWSTPVANVQMVYTAASHTYTISASDVATLGRAMAMSFGEISAAGTFSLGTGLPFRYADVAAGNKVWETSITVSNGAQVIIDVATPTRLKGHLIYTGTPAPSSPTTTGTVGVDVTFDLTTTSSN